jgi:hypothetical protein
VSQPAYPPYQPQSAPGHGASPVPSQDELRHETEAAAAARRDLGPEYEEAIAAGLADRMEQIVAYRTAELRAHGEQQATESNQERVRRTQRFVLGIISIGAGIPITAISAVQVDPSLLGVLVSWAGIVGVNVAANLSDRKRS